ncbi:hypothetical protein NDU88_000166 [Pleurodeles waltl]|uniref:Uncharacterized protein n=1 Tax=Pleurodeles waltl TaxID=8319 RepID=A0AAV7VWL2_PLEWA|nr:hypothetical protein NDU88_000166 [Pleurodeles waltl]
MLARLRNTCGQWPVVYQDIAGAPKWWYNVDCASSKGEIGGVTHPTGHPHAGCCQGGPSAAYCCRSEYPCGAYTCAHGRPHWEQGHTRLPSFGRGAPSGGAPAGTAVPPQHCRVPPPKSGALAISPSLAGSSPHAHRGPPLTRGRGFRGDERPQVSSPSGQLHAGHNTHRAQRGGPAVPPTFRQLGRTI